MINYTTGPGPLDGSKKFREQQLELNLDLDLESTGRKAVIVEETHYVVRMYEGDTLAEERPLYGHSKRYAEDCAENWENGVIKI
jgi:hypothetical protein